MDSEVQCVIPTRSTNDMFLISLRKGKALKYLSISEGDLLDFSVDDGIRQEIMEKVKGSLSELAGC
jgi:hypothetical protein